MKSIHDYCVQSDGDLFGGNESDMEGEKELKDEGRSEVIDTQKVSALSPWSWKNTDKINSSTGKKI